MTSDLNPGERVAQLQDGHAPWEWLKDYVSLDGEGYELQSPAGGRLKITNEHRLRIVACVKACEGFETDLLEALEHEELLGCWHYTKDHYNTG